MIRTLVMMLDGGGKLRLQFGFGFLRAGLPQGPLIARKRGLDELGEAVLDLLDSKSLKAYVPASVEVVGDELPVCVDVLLPLLASHAHGIRCV